MIKFDLLRAKQSVPMRTRQGYEAKLIAHLDGGQPAPLVVEIINREVDERGRIIGWTPILENYYLNGKDGVVDSPLDLFMEY